MSAPIPRSGTPRYHEGSPQRSPRDADATNRAWLKNRQSAQQLASGMNNIQNIQRQIDALRRKMGGAEGYPTLHPFQIYQLPRSLQSNPSNWQNKFRVHAGKMFVRQKTRTASESSANKTVYLPHPGDGTLAAGYDMQTDLVADIMPPSPDSYFSRTSTGDGVNSVYRNIIIPDADFEIDPKAGASSNTNYCFYVELTEPTPGVNHAEIKTVLMDGSGLGYYGAIDPMLIIGFVYNFYTSITGSIGPSKQQWVISQVRNTNIYDLYPWQSSGAMQWRGTYDAETIYYYGDVVQYNSGIGGDIGYIQIDSSSAHANSPPDITYIGTVWKRLTP